MFQSPPARLLLNGSKFGTIEKNHRTCAPPGDSHHLLIEVPERCQALLQNAQRGALPEELSSEPGAGDWCNIYYHLCMDSLWII